MDSTTIRADYVYHIMYDHPALGTDDHIIAIDVVPFVAM